MKQLGLFVLLLTTLFSITQNLNLRNNNNELESTNTTYENVMVSSTPVLLNPSSNSKSIAPEIKPKKEMRTVYSSPRSGVQKLEAPQIVKTSTKGTSGKDIDKKEDQMITDEQAINALSQTDPDLLEQFKAKLIDPNYTEMEAYFMGKFKKILTDSVPQSKVVPENAYSKIVKSDFHVDEAPQITEKSVTDVINNPPGNSKITELD